MVVGNCEAVGAIDILGAGDKVEGFVGVLSTGAGVGTNGVGDVVATTGAFVVETCGAVGRFGRRVGPMMCRFGFRVGRLVGR